MQVFFLDTSTLAKRYLNETGSAWVLSWIEPAAGNVSIISELAEVELYSIFARRLRENLLTSAQVSHYRRDFAYHAKYEYLVVPLDKSVVARAKTLVFTYKLRALDALQLASVQESIVYTQVTPIFICADNNLLNAAASEGFQIDNPLNHP